MDHGLALAVMTLAGAVIALQPPLNARLAERTGGLPAATVSFLVGSALLLGLVLLTGRADGLRGVVDVSVVYLLGGVIGAGYVLASLLVVRIVGAGGLSAALICGQLGAAVLLVDRLGVLGLDPTPVTAQRLLGVALLIAGTTAIVSRR
jgi:transporter family-2 protein